MIFLVLTLSITFIKNKKVFKNLKNKIRFNKCFKVPINNGFNGAYSGMKIYFIQKNKARIKRPRDKKQKLEPPRSKLIIKLK